MTVGNNDNTDANGWQYRSGGGHLIGEPMPGTFGDSERVIHDKDGNTPTYDGDECEVPSHEDLHEETTEDKGLGVDELVGRLRK